MSGNVPEKGLQLRTLVKESGELELSLIDVPVPQPGDDDVLIRVEATPINPSDLGLLVGAGDLSTLRKSGTDSHPVVTADIPKPGMRAMAGRVGQSLPVGNEGAGTVVAAGKSPAAQALLGKKVTGLGGEFYAEYRLLNVAQVMELPEGTSARDGASCFVNPLTALSFPETMRMEDPDTLRTEDLETVQMEGPEQQRRRAAGVRRLRPDRRAPRRRRRRTWGASRPRWTAPCRARRRGRRSTSWAARPLS